MNDERDFYGDNQEVQKADNIFLGYDFYDKSEIYESDDYVRDKNGNLYLRENFLQANLGLDGNLIDPNEE